MQRIFNMLIQNLTNMGHSITQVNFWDGFTKAEFTDGKKKYVVTISEEKEDKENGN